MKIIKLEQSEPIPQYIYKKYKLINSKEHLVPIQLINTEEKYGNETDSFEKEQLQILQNWIVRDDGSEILDSFMYNPGLQHIGLQILDYLDGKTLLSCRRVNKSWKNILDNPKIWLKQIILKGEQSMASLEDLPRKYVKFCKLQEEFFVGDYCFEEFTEYALNTLKKTKREIAKFLR